MEGLRSTAFGFVIRGGSVAGQGRRGGDAATRKLRTARAPQVREPLLNRTSPVPVIDVPENYILVRLRR